MGKFVEPEVYLVGYTTLHSEGLEQYLKVSGNLDFLDSVYAAREQGLSDGEILCSFYAKLCYASLTLGHNQNITRIRDISDNIQGCFGHGHSAVFEHCLLNFVVRNCSRIYTHEQVRHRVGVAYSQTSGRYVRGDVVNVIFDPILEPIRDLCQHGIEVIEALYKEMVQEIGLDNETDFDRKKKITSALRRFLPNGQSNEMGMSINITALRHIVQARTSRHAEWEIRNIYNQVYKILKEKFPLMFYGANEEEFPVGSGLLEITAMKTKPY